MSSSIEERALKYWKRDQQQDTAVHFETTAISLICYHEIVHGQAERSSQKREVHKEDDGVVGTVKAEHETSICSLYDFIFWHRDELKDELLISLNCCRLVK